MAAAKDPYANMAGLYDSLANTKEIRLFYSRWRDYLLSAIRQCQIPVRLLVDLACGTGNTAIPWTKQKNWTVIGITVHGRCCARLGKNQGKCNGSARI